MKKYMQIDGDFNSVDGLVQTLGFFCISIMLKILEVSLPAIDTYLVVIVHFSQLAAALIACYIGYHTIKNIRKQK